MQMTPSCYSLKLGKSMALETTQIIEVRVGFLSQGMLWHAADLCAEGQVRLFERVDPLKRAPSQAFSIIYHSPTGVAVQSVDLICENKVADVVTFLRLVLHQN